MSEEGGEASRWWRLAGMVGFPLFLLIPWFALDALAPGHTVLGFDVGVYAAGAAAACVAAACLVALLWLRSVGEATRAASRNEVLVAAAVAFLPAWWLFFAAFSGLNASKLGEASAALCALSDCDKKRWCLLTCALPDKSKSQERLSHEPWFPPEGKRFEAQVRRGRMGVWMLDNRSVRVQ